MDIYRLYCPLTRDDGDDDIIRILDDFYIRTEMGEMIPCHGLIGDYSMDIHW